MIKTRKFIGPNKSRHEAQADGHGGWYMSCGSHRYGLFSDEMLIAAIERGTLTECHA